MANERILVVEDERAVARGLAYGLRDEGFEVLVAPTGEEALALARSRDPHLILLDIRLPDISGFDVCRQLRSEEFHQPIIMVTARDEEVDKVLGLELGADDYVVKPYSLRELTSRIRAMLRRAYGELASQPGGDRLRFGEIEIDLETLQVTRDGEPVELTPTEFRLLRALTSRPGRPVRREMLIEDAWGYPSDVGSHRTVDAHMRHLRLKLEDDPANPRWLVTVRGVGYKFEP
jgi:DNA-binding response OmpR family regulator